MAGVAMGLFKGIFYASCVWLMVPAEPDVGLGRHGEVPQVEVAARNWVQSRLEFIRDDLRKQYPDGLTASLL